MKISYNKINDYYMNAGALGHELRTTALKKLTKSLFISISNTFSTLQVFHNMFVGF